MSAPAVRRLLFAAVLLAAGPPAARAADPADTALGKVPADAEAFAASLRMGETVAAIGKSRAWKLIRETPAVKDAVAKAWDGFNNSEEQGAVALRKFLADPANKDLPALAADAVSNEVFAYIGDGWGDSLALIQEVFGAVRYGPAFARVAGAGAGEQGKLQARIALRALAEKPDRIRVSPFVVGFKVSDPGTVAAQLRRLDPVVADALSDTMLKGRSARTKVGGDDFLTLSVDGSLAEWDPKTITDLEEKDGEFAPLVKRLKTMKFTLAVGVRKGYLVVAGGETADHLAKFGGGGPALAGRDEMKPLAKLGGKPLTAVSYTSKKLREVVATTAEDVTGFAQLIKSGLENAALPEEQAKAIEKDIDELSASFAKALVKPGAAASFTARTASGWETFEYDWTPPSPAPAKPLTLLNHLGGNPLLAAVGRSGTTVDDFKSFASWAGRFSDHVEKAIEAKVPQAGPAIDIYRKDFRPLLKEMGDVTEKSWLPALADGQEAFVLDAEWTSKQWHAAMPEADRPLPMFEIALVLGVSDAGKLVDALSGYRDVLNKMLAKAAEHAQAAGGNMPEVRIPNPQVEKAGGKTFAFYPIPPFLGVDEQFRPTGGLSDTVAVLTLSKGHADRLLKSTPLAGSGPLADPKKPLRSAFIFNWAGMVDAVGPWVGYAAKLKGAGDDVGKTSAKVTAVLKVFRGYTSATYVEGGATVTHGEAVFRDIDPTADE